ncbi:hypothetical protein [Chryseobacterium mucoviscidosis]|uniref:Uncharacterized protein n=1 Tax=Chryseobacterium mucoviscidosis TaxID=1945581 RepID=A0A202BTT1_9FLAO|nr:hypothetical protein [Chryseobacterium mucoviscidosis]OVE54755.1 hypothetical protein B0E34_18200 [Chryseobacterium mucoviscidosis]
MSTTDLNTNNSSQTLFRFAASRNPELSDPKNINRRFIFRDHNSRTNSLIDSKVNSTMSLQKLLENPGNISGFTILTEEDLKLGYAAFYELAVWVARNKATANKSEFDEKIKKYNDYLATNMPAVITDYSVIWDNLIYQVVTQKDFYAKETIMQFLHLNHILSVYEFSEEIYQDVIKAKVVLPKELFKAPNSTVPSPNPQSTSKTVMYDQKSMKMAEATMLLEQNQNLSATLKKLQDNYKKEYDDAYKIAFSNYQAEVKPLQKQLQKETAAADNRKQILENRINYLTQLSVADPEKFYANSELDMELHRIKDEIMNISYSEIELPEFTFSFAPEIDASALERSLGKEEKEALCRVFGTASISAALSAISTYDEINTAITQNNQSLQQTVLNNTVLNQQTYANVGGVVVPVGSTSSSNSVIPMFARTWLPFMSSEHNMMIRTDINNPVSIVSGSYTLKGHDQQIIATASTADVYSAPNVSVLFNGLNKIPNSIISKYEIVKLEGEVTLNDGLDYTMEATLTVTANSSYRFEGPGTFTAKDRGNTGTGTGAGTGTGTGTGTSSGTTAANPKGTFIPSGFGMKNIGITDYKKVEQSTYCYVEGDVAHIENIMAREYKERATRKLRRSENQTTKSTESEKEKLSDTTSTDRHEMQSEISKILQESKDFAAQAGFNASWGMGDNKYGLNVGANYATHNSKEESNRQAVTEAKDITARALDRIVTKVKEERIDKIIEEFEENNKHGFDNTKGSSHVVGVYRWVDKVVKNQIYNYGKRMMFEFMVPEPAKLHKLGMTISKNQENQLVKPVDPRESNVQKLENFSSLEDETKLKFWLSKYSVEIDERPVESFSIGKSLNGQTSKDISEIEFYTMKDEIQIPDGYIATYGLASFSAASDGDGSNVNLLLGDLHYHQWGLWGQANVFDRKKFPKPYSKSVPISSTGFNEFAGTSNFIIDVELTQEAKNAWLQKTFNKIIEAYELEMDKYNQALAEIKAMGVEIKGSNPGFYRKIENTILRRNCISYMLEQNPNVDLTFGRGKYYNNGYSSGDETFLNTDIKVDEKLDQYAAFAKFMEQAFEWEIMSYYFYPYYWGERKSWADLYQFDDNDPVFRAFMQSGMARVIVTVRPGFEEAVRHFLATGQIWNGGEVPVIDDPLFLSIVDEMRSPKATKEGEPWRERIPTSLTILQADSIGLRVEKALPCNCEPGVKFDDNLGEMCATNFEMNQNQIGQSEDKWMEISFNKMDLVDYKTIEDLYNKTEFPRKYTCLGNEIIIDKDANWKLTDSSVKFYQALANEISAIEGVEAYPTGENGITFKINIGKVKKFNFIKPHDSKELDQLDFTTDGISYLKISSPEYTIKSIPNRILDAKGVEITEQELSENIPLTRFLV